MHGLIVLIAEEAVVRRVLVRLGFKLYISSSGNLSRS